MKYKAVIFDLYGTLVPTFSESKYRLLVLQMAAALNAPPEPFWELWAASFNDSFLGIIQDSRAKIVLVCDKLRLNPEPSKISEQTRLLFEHETLAMIPRPDAAGVLSALKQKQHKIGLISDCASETVAFWDNMPIKPFFDTVVFSCVAGVKKPDPRIYRLAMERLKVKPQDCLYIGDGSSYELTGARKVGMHPVQIHVPGEIVYFLDADDWHGATITSLNEVLDLVK
jgi:putative hydrolase of the HAD superfamily